MSIYVVFYGCATKPEEVDEIKGYFEEDELTLVKAYCDVKNTLADKDWSYWYEEVKKLRP